jgi:hypothetical protein
MANKIITSRQGNKVAAVDAPSKKVATSKERTAQVINNSTNGSRRKECCIWIDKYSAEFLREVVWRTDKNKPDNSLEYAEEVEMTVSELAELLATDQAEVNKDAIIIYLDKSACDFLERVRVHYQVHNNALFQSFELSEDMEKFLYSLGVYIKNRDFRNPFSY